MSYSKICVCNCDESCHNSLSLAITTKLFITLHNMLKSSWLAPDEFGGGTCGVRGGTCGAGGDTYCIGGGTKRKEGGP